MKIKKIDHLGITVQNYDEIKKIFEEVLGLEFLKEEVSEEWNCKMAFYQCGESMLEISAPTGPGVDQDFIDATGGGIHHIALEVEDIDDALEACHENLVLRDQEPRPGADGTKVFFLEPSSIGNMETEFMQYTKKDNE